MRPRALPISGFLHSRNTASCRTTILAASAAGARVDMDEYEKADARDFVLWKEPRRRRALLAYAARGRSTGLAYRVFHNGDEISGARRSIFTPGAWT